MTALARRDEHPELGFFEIPFPEGAPPGSQTAKDAETNALTLSAWARAVRFAAILADAFPAPPPGAQWGCEVSARERFVGEWLDGEYETSAYVAVGVLIAPGDDVARAFAERVRADAPRRWPD